MTTKEKLVSRLFQTGAIRVCKEGQPFWYTSGTIGPYYVNTHFLYGGESFAEELLMLIDNARGDKEKCPARVLEAAMEHYYRNEIYREVMNEMIWFIRENVPLEEVDLISGGERRDWFFSLVAAELLEKPHVSIFKDLSVVVTNNGEQESLSTLKGKRILHIADLITEASSYERAWIPAIQMAGGRMTWSVVVVDRKQGGVEILEGYGVQSFAMMEMDGLLFDKALEMGLINKEQHRMIIEFLEDPKESMRNFLIQNPEFLKKSLEEGGKIEERARLCLSRNIYNLNPGELEGLPI